MIYAENLTKHFADFVAVQGINLDVPAGQVLALLGPNGAGKTTTVRMLTSVLRPTSGSAKIAGYDVVQEAEKVRASVGVLTEHHGLYARMNADEYLTFYGRLYRMPDPVIEQRKSELLEQFGLSDARKKKLGEYSKGMRQKLALVRALLHNPPVLLLDEPTSAMDPESARIVRDAILALRSDQRAVILCTHNLAEAEQLADQIAIIRRGRIILNDVPERLKRVLLGPEEYEVVMRNGAVITAEILPHGVTLSRQENGRFVFQIDQPQATIPVLLKSLLDHNLPVLSCAPVPRSLEEAYLRAVSLNEENRNESN
ncbi:MAG: ABC transporter ATP-binding protein [Chloroflexota bacterium]|jgi:ABC-2 type transport system ATP-binding protein|uniref:ABC transporter ATP-binding protein n=1 Tax=Bellilinea caldifistulae TaxID=360411 RepID=A0A7C4Q3A7_9CHLR|nr:ABC transporter ATP-binding protein [Bellilinea sp.]